MDRKLVPRNVCVGQHESQMHKTLGAQRREQLASPGGVGREFMVPGI